MILYSTAMPGKIQPFYLLAEGLNLRCRVHLDNAQLAYFEPKTFQFVLQILRRIVLFIWKPLENAHDLSISSMLLSHLKKLGFADWVRELTKNLVDEICVNVHRCHLSFTLCFISTQALNLVSSLAKTILLLPNSIGGKRCRHLKTRTRTLPKDIFRHVSAKLEGSIFLSTVKESCRRLCGGCGPLLPKFYIQALKREKHECIITLSPLLRVCIHGSEPSQCHPSFL
jgi:hypothetical protein